MQETVFILLTWIGSHTAYNVNISLPNISMLEPYNVCQNYGIKHMGNCDASKLMGFYNKKKTIYLHNDFDHTNLEDESRLIHELVHYVQWANGKNNETCLGKLEVEAYEIQDEWRVQHNLKQILDPFRKIMLEASCDS